MQVNGRSRWLGTSVAAAVAVLALGCGGAARPAVQAPAQPAEPAQPAQPAQPAPAVAIAAACDAAQAQISREADERAAPYDLAQHLAKNFPDGQVAWVMPEALYQKYVVATGATKWGRCDATACYLFAAPAAVIREAVAASMQGGAHDPAALGRALGLPAKNLEGPLRLMTLDLDAAPATCARLPVDADPGVWKCQTAADTDCFKFGGYTSGGAPELMVIDAPIARTAIEVVP